jgi:ferrous iron transport protein A
MSLGFLQRVVPLDLLEAGERGRVVDVDGGYEMVGRLAEMGISAGSDLRVLRPGQPCIVAVGDQRISFRGETAAVVLVETDVDAGCH